MPDPKKREPISHRAVRRSAGAALTETVVLLFVMIPLMFAIPMIGRLADVRQTAVQAARYATWEATVAPAGTDHPAQLDTRFFGDAAQALTSDETAFASHAVRGAASGTSGQLASDEFADGGWQRHSAVHIDEATIVATPWRTTADDLGVARMTGRAVRSAGKVLGGGRWDLADTVLTRASVGVNVKMNGWFEEQAIRCGAGAGGCVSESGVILIDGWESGSDAQTRERVRALVPATHLESVGAFLSNLGALPILAELRGVERMFGHVDLTPLPEHAHHGLDVYEAD